MGYTHYWYRKPVIELGEFAGIAKDFRRVAETLEDGGLILRGWSGTGASEIADQAIRFNGDEECGHRQVDLGITWPARGAQGVSAEGPVVAGSWIAGALLGKRSCGGDCSHESVVLDRVYQPLGEWDTPKPDGRYFACCKTAYKPYDLAVTAALVIAKHYLGGDILVRSDGESGDWDDARWLCQEVLGYGADFRLDDDFDDDEEVSA